MFRHGYFSFAVIFFDFRGVNLEAAFKRNPKMGIFIAQIPRMTLSGLFFFAKNGAFSPLFLYILYFFNLNPNQFSS